MIDFDGMDASDDETQEENERVLAFFDQLVDHGTDMSSSDEGIHVCFYQRVVMFTIDPLLYMYRNYMLTHTYTHTHTHTHTWTHHNGKALRSELLMFHVVGPR